MYWIILLKYYYLIKNVGETYILIRFVETVF